MTIDYDNLNKNPIFNGDLKKLKNIKTIQIESYLNYIRLFYAETLFKKKDEKIIILNNLSKY